jgi:TctA family transporter
MLLDGGIEEDIDLGGKLFTLALQIPKAIMIPIVIMMCVAGVFAIDQQIATRTGIDFVARDVSHFLRHMLQKAAEVPVAQKGDGT